MRIKQIEYTSAIGNYKRKHTLFFDADVMTEQDALNEVYYRYLECGCYNPEFIGHYITIPETKMPFLAALIKEEKEKAREEGFEAGQANMLEAGYHL